jgi:thymidylate synthase (FAD)
MEMVVQECSKEEAAMPQILVLDHGFVRLVDYMGSDLSIVRAARISHDAAWRAGADSGSDERLINYLWRHHHTTPFEAVTFTFEIKAPIFVFRQWHRHRTWSYNEVSARYRELPEEFYVPEADNIGAQDAANKQGRWMGNGTELIAERAKETEVYRQSCTASMAVYHSFIAAGWPRELARGVLPVSTYSHMFGTVNLLNLFRFLTLRLDSHAQYEIRVYAEAMLALIEPIVPVCTKAFRETFADGK